MNNMIQIRLIETYQGDLNNPLCLNIKEHINNIKYVSDQFITVYNQKDIKNMIENLHYNIFDIFLFILGNKLPINSFNRTYVWNLKTIKYVKDIEDLFINEIKLVINDNINIKLHIIFIFKDFTSFTLDLNDQEKKMILDIILYNYWFELREKNTRSRSLTI